MPRYLTYLLFAFTLFTARPAHALTYDEPWMDEVIRRAESFVLVRVIEADPKEGIRVKVLDRIGGVKTRKKFRVAGFSLLRITSQTGEGKAEFNFHKGDSLYLLVSPGEDGYHIATPTSGFAVVKDGLVYGAFRHSLHPVLIPRWAYENAMKAIFLHLHAMPFDRDWTRAFIGQMLAEDPAESVDKSSIGVLFLQHVALEMVHYLEMTGYCEDIERFIDAREFHLRLSAIRALRACRWDRSRELLLSYIEDPLRENFGKVMAVHTLKAIGPGNFRDRLEKMLPTVSDEWVSFQGDARDPRIGTYVPSVRQALEGLLETY